MIVMERVDCTVKNELCIGCGICKAVCPVHCIAYEEVNGIYAPQIDEKTCVNCGVCAGVCPGMGFDYTKYCRKEDDFWFGKQERLYSAWTKDSDRRATGVSGGVVTELVHLLLETGEFDSAFLVDTHTYGNQPVFTEQITEPESLLKTCKSRYLTVSQEKAIAYMLAHRQERLVLVGTSCFVQGLMKVMDQYRLSRDHYVIIGLFCDKTMTMDVISYFDEYARRKGKEMEKLYFRTKEVGGWPGGVRIETKDQQVIDLPNTERMKVKEYFQPERCLYCLDKLNQFADISVGDNYTGEHSDKGGSNSVVIRTKQGLAIWEKYKEHFVYEETTKEQIAKSQHLEKRKQNLAFAACKEEITGSIINQVDGLVNREVCDEKMQKQYRKRLSKIAVGQQFKKHPGRLYRRLLPKTIKNRIRRILSKNH